MTINSRNKGAAFEREIAKELHLQTGVTFQRDLEQYRAADRGDLIATDDAWPFVVECKRYAAGDGCRSTWQAQATKAATAAGKLPCVVFKFDRRPVRVSVPFAAIAAGLDAKSDCAEWVEISIDGLAYIAREIMAWRA